MQFDASSPSTNEFEHGNTKCSLHYEPNREEVVKQLEKPQVFGPLKDKKEKLLSPLVDNRQNFLDCVSKVNPELLPQLSAVIPESKDEPQQKDEFYVRYYVGHKGRFGHEFMELELHPSGKLRYANNSNYKHEPMIRKEVFVSPAVVEEVKRIIVESGITSVDDRNWQEPKTRQQELEIKIGNQHIAFTCAEIGSLIIGLVSLIYFVLDCEFVVVLIDKLKQIAQEIRQAFFSSYGKGRLLIDGIVCPKFHHFFPIVFADNH